MRTCRVFAQTVTYIIISDSLFHHNGITEQGANLKSIGSLAYIDQQIQQTQNLSLLITHTKFIYNGLCAIYITDLAATSTITLNQVKIFDNKFGVLIAMLMKVIDNNLLDITSCHFFHNYNGTLAIQLSEGNVNVHNTKFANKKGANIYCGSTLCFIGITTLTINISMCTFHDTIGGDNILYFSRKFLNRSNRGQLTLCNVSITSATFTGNTIGSVKKMFKNAFLIFTPRQYLKVTLQKVVLHSI